MTFQFSTAPRVVFGAGAADNLADEARTMGVKACLVCGSDPGRVDGLAASLGEAGLAPLVVPVSGEPDTDFIKGAVDLARSKGCDVFAAVGGGSVLDAGKALAALTANTRDVFDYLEVVGRGMPLQNQPLPLIAVPTTSGTGAEVTANAVLLSTRHGVKVSLRSRSMIPDLALVDPRLAASMPPKVTASTGMDALTQLLEAFVSHAANPLTNALCREGLPRAARSLRTAYDDGSDMDARTDMALAALFSGMALANAKLGAVHGLAAPLGGAFHAPHGAVCAALLPHVMEMNVRALRQRAPEHPSLAAYGEAARIFTANSDAGPEDGAAWVQDLCAALSIPGLGDMGVTRADFPDLAAKGAQAGSMKGNPIPLETAELLEILDRAL